jgi:hypothetical protein
MHDAGVALLAAWESFYVIVGSSSAGLTGLMFVVVTLIPEAQSRGTKVPVLGIAVFSTPTIVHFCSALLVSTILSAPWGTLSPAGMAIALTGIAGLVFTIVVAVRMRRVPSETEYRPVLEDLVCHLVLPLVVYATLVIAGMMLRHRPTPSLFAIGAATLLILFVGIHNAWDTVMWMAFERAKTK